MRTGWKTRPRPKTVVLAIKINQSINQSISLSLSLSLFLSSPLSLSLCLSHTPAEMHNSVHSFSLYVSVSLSVCLPSPPPPPPPPPPQPPSPRSAHPPLICHLPLTPSPRPLPCRCALRGAASVAERGKRGRAICNQDTQCLANHFVSISLKTMVSDGDKLVA